MNCVNAYDRSIFQSYLCSFYLNAMGGLGDGWLVIINRIPIYICILDMPTVLEITVPILTFNLIFLVVKFLSKKLLKPEPLNISFPYYKINCNNKMSLLHM